MDEEKKKSFISWASFFGIVAFVLASVYLKMWLAAVFFAIIAIFSFPHAETNKKIKDWLTVAMYLIIMLIVIGAVIWGISKLFGGIGGLGKYEGQTAEEWFNDYDYAESKYQELYDCVEPYLLGSGNISADDLRSECF